ncbi:hypothetical protein EFA46_015845 (plasmid) [Halarchaeum sp. CBA1220]|nr:hypothetical protein EFA46_015845 [Halarchaeum sp. CBA1220]
MHLDPVKRNDWLHRSAGAAFFEFEDAEHFEVFEVGVHVGDITLNEPSGLAHTLGVVFGDCLRELQPEWCETIDEVVVAAELEDCSVVVIVEVTSVRVLDERECVLAKLFSVADSDVECGHDS